MTESDLPLALPALPPPGCRIRVLGLGGGGANALGRMLARWPAGPDCVAVNTDAAALASCGVPRTLVIGRSVTQGFGAGGDVALGRMAAEEGLDLLRDLVGHVDLLFLVVALGGGTGSGAAPVLAELARDAGALTICLATLPFEFEGERRKRDAAEALRGLRAQADVVITLPNEMLLSEMEEETGLVEAFQRADAKIGTAVYSLWKLLTKAGIINLDFSDLRNLVENSGGSCVFAYGEAEGPGRAEAAVEQLLRAPGLENGQLMARAGAYLLSITGGADFTLAEMQRIRARFAELAPAEARVFMGAAIAEEWASRLALTLLVAEHWREEGDAPATGSDTAAGASPGKGRGAGDQRIIQPHLPFDPGDKGRFKGVDPTIVEGEDLDIPTFIRRGIKLSFDR